MMYTHIIYKDFYLLSILRDNCAHVCKLCVCAYVCVHISSPPPSLRVSPPLPHSPSFPPCRSLSSPLPPPLPHRAHTHQHANIHTSTPTHLHANMSLLGSEYQGLAPSCQFAHLFRVVDLGFRLSICSPVCARVRVSVCVCFWVCASMCARACARARVGVGVCKGVVRKT